LNTYTIGQRWLSEMEPELGLGIITEISARRIHIQFPASETTREYAIASAPIKRLLFSVGDEIKTTAGETHRVTAIEESNDLISYVCDSKRVPEQELDSLLSFSSPMDRLFSGFYDTNGLFDLRIRALHWRSIHRQSPAYGFIGPRMELIPHQLYVAQQIASRLKPRVLLSDQVGLGKTIEACLIMHRLLLSRRIERVLIIVPESLVHQWFIELLRRFNLLFRILDADYVDSLLKADEERNPFDDEQLMLCSLEFLTTDPTLHNNLYNAGWDLIILDEAHHILEDTQEYEIVEQLAKKSGGLMLLTATPEQLGHRSHFARLKLLDPSRYDDYEKFLQESEHYHKVAGIANSLLSGESLQSEDFKLLKTLLPATGNKNNVDLDKAELKAPEKIISQLVDRYGVGRVMFRNTRAAIPNFPKRKLHVVPLEAIEAEQKKAIVEFKNDVSGEPLLASLNYKNDPRMLWLLKFLKSHKTKILLICNSIEKTKAIESALTHLATIKYALFHEEMTLLQRDRNAAWFAEKDGAQVLICSEIGSEGRNFQFAHHLILFDVPVDPELLEQRIGRLDRIGQKQTINIWAPAIAKSPQENLIKWYDEGFNAFEINAIAAFQIYEKFSSRLLAALGANNPRKLEKLVAETKAFNEEMSTELEKGRNRLLEINSFRKSNADELIQHIKKLDSNNSFQEFMVDLFQHFEVQIDELSSNIFYLKIDFLTHQDVPLPKFRSDGLPITFSRKIAVAREDVEFLSPDHPTVMGTIDLLLGSEKGNAALSLWPDKNSQELLLEAFFVLECIAPARLHIDRFFPPIPLRIVANHLGENKTEKYTTRIFEQKLRNAVNPQIIENPSIRQNIVPAMVDNCSVIAESKSEKIIDQRRRESDAAMTSELNRLISLKKVNPDISQDEIESIKEERQAILNAIDTARLRLDSIRFIIRGEY
jgi:ATP-dependent helicase HepA